MKVSRKDLISFIVVGIIYILWVIWLRNYWYFFGLLIIFDIYVTQKVNWTFWKRRDGKNSKVIEWIDALIFAVIAVTIINIFLFQNYKIPTGSMEKSLLVGDHLYVSKVAYGPRIPNTPIAFPFTQHTLPLTKQTKSFVEWIRLPYNRLTGFGKIKRDDPVVFNFPAGDTVVIQHQNVSYYQLVRDAAMNFQRQDRVAGRPQKEIPGIQYEYYVLMEGQSISPRVLNRMDIYETSIIPGTPHISARLTDENVEKIKALKNVKEVRRYYDDTYDYSRSYNYFPSD